MPALINGSAAYRHVEKASANADAYFSETLNRVSPVQLCAQHFSFCDMETLLRQLSLTTVPLLKTVLITVVRSPESQEGLTGHVSSCGSNIMRLG